VKELTALDASRQREILREWLARSETVSPSSLADDYEEFVITAVRDRPKAATSGLSPQAAEAARKLPAWTFVVGALPVVVVLVLAHVGRGSAPLPSPRPEPTLSTVQTTAAVLDAPPSQPSAVAVRPTPTVAPARKSPSIRTPATPPAAPVPEVNTELAANSEFGGRK
jgi:hypothetical protein